MRATRKIGIGACKNPDPVSLGVQGCDTRRSRRRLADNAVTLVPISIVGLPASGKTTFLAALWELVQEGRVEKCLDFHSTSDADCA